MSLGDAIKLAVKIIKENMEQKINKDNIEVTYMTTTERRIVNISTEEIAQLIQSLQ